MVRAIASLCALLSLVGSGFAVSRAVEQRAKRNTINPRSLVKRDTDPSLLYPAYNLSVPIDHFHNDSLYEPHSSGSFNLRYWFDASYYQQGGPVIVLQSGETEGTDRLPYLQKGLLHELAIATHGIAVVLEHRYYGTSIPTPDLSTENLRFLTTDQALADEAYFAKNIVFPGFEHKDLTAPNVAYIGYGGSYAGAFNAFLRKLYPEVFWGTISSSGVVEAIYDYWEYFEPIRVYGGEPCISYIQKITNIVDNILIKVNSTATTNELKAAWGLPNVTYNDDFAVAIAYPLDYWQSLNWDPAINDPTFDNFCTAIESSTLQYPSSASLNATVKDLIAKGGYASETSTLYLPFLNWIGFLGENFVAGCSPDQDACFGTHDEAAYYAQDDITQDWRAWPYQYCTQWGFLQTGSGVPANQLPIITRLNTLEYNSIICVEAFNITEPPNLQAVNKYGGFDISYPRLAIIDGEHDPWRPATPHANPFNSTAHNRTSTTEEPFILIDGAVHHWDENGLFPNQTTPTLPPAPIAQVQKAEIAFVVAWMQEWAEAQHHYKRNNLRALL